MRQTALALLIAPVLGGCFTYVPVERNAVAPEMSIRVRMTETASRRMEATRDPDTPIEGRVFNVSGNQFSLLPELGSRGTTEPISFNFNDIRVFEHRQMSQTKTWAMVAAGMAGGVLLVLAVDGDLLGGGGTGGPGDFSVLPGFRIPFSP
jgi:hypothetical protein